MTELRKIWLIISFFFFLMKFCKPDKGCLFNSMCQVQRDLPSCEQNYRNGDAYVMVAKYVIPMKRRTVLTKR